MQTKQEVTLSEIRMDSAQGRERIHEKYVETYATDYDAGCAFPLPVLFYDGKFLWIGDGWHRILALLKLGRKKVEAEVNPGGKEEAMLFNVKANSLPRGIPLTTGDRKHAAKMLLKSKKYAFRTDEAIAKLIGCSSSTVSDARLELERGGAKFPNKRISSGGKVVSVSRIGTSSNGEKREPKMICCPRCGGKGKIPNPKYGVSKVTS